MKVESDNVTLSINVRRGRQVAGLSIGLGLLSYVVPYGLELEAGQNAALLLSIGGIVASVLALMKRDRGMLAIGMAVTGLLLSIVSPALFLLLLYASWISH